MTMTTPPTQHNSTQTLFRQWLDLSSLLGLVDPLSIHDLARTGADYPALMHKTENTISPDSGDTVINTLYLSISRVKEVLSSITKRGFVEHQFLDEVQLFGGIASVFGGPDSDKGESRGVYQREMTDYILVHLLCYFLFLIGVVSERKRSLDKYTNGMVITDVPPCISSHISELNEALDELRLTCIDLWNRITPESRVLFSSLSVSAHSKLIVSLHSSVRDVEYGEATVCGFNTSALQIPVISINN